MFGIEQNEFHVREIVRRTALNLAAVQQELKRLESMDLVVRRKDGNRVYFKANQHHPLFNDLRQLTLKTTGIVPMLREALNPAADQIDYAFVFGSVARSEEKAHSDVDIICWILVVRAIRTDQINCLRIGIMLQNNAHDFIVFHHKWIIPSSQTQMRWMFLSIEETSTFQNHMLG